MKWKTTLWRIPASSRTLDGSGRKAALEELVTLDAFDGAVKCVLWNPEDSMPDQFATVDDSAVSLWTLCDGRKAADVKCYAESCNDCFRNHRAFKWPGTKDRSSSRMQGGIHTILTRL